VIGAITAGLFGVGTPPVTNSYESIATVSVGAGGSSSISFTSIPSTYKHLQIRFIARRSTTGIADTGIRFNSDSTSSYKSHYIIADGSSVSAGAPGGDTNIQNWYTTGSDATSNVFGVDIIDILDYANTSKNKTTRSLSGFDSNGSGTANFTSGVWLKTDAINAISLTPNSGNFVQYSHFALYGIKG